MYEILFPQAFMTIFLRLQAKALFANELPKLVKEYASYNLYNLRDYLNTAYEESEIENKPYLASDWFYAYILNWNLKAFKDSLQWYIFDPSLSRLIYEIKGTFDWSMGLGWLSWASTSAYINNLVVKPLEQYIKEKYRPDDLSKSDYEDALRYLLVSVKEYEEFLAKQGLPDNKIRILKRRLAYELFNSHLKTLLHYNIVDTASVYNLLRELGIDDDNATKLLLSAFKTPSESKILDWYKQNVIAKGKALEWLQYLGYSRELAEFILTHISKEKSTKDRDLTKSDIKQMYIRGIITQDQARDFLIKLGYDENEAQLLLELWKTELTNREKTLTYSQIKQLYLNNLIGREEAIKYLNELGYSPNDIEYILKLWDLEKQKRHLKLNLSVIHQAYRYNVISEQEAVQYLQQLGYSQQAIQLYIKIWNEEKKKEPKKPSASFILRLFSYGIITAQEAVNKLVELGYDVQTAQLYVELYERMKAKTGTKLTTSQILRAYKKGVIPEDLAYHLLLLKGYQDWEAQILIALYSK